MIDLKSSEIKKAERLACKITGKQDCRVSGYFTSRTTDSFQTFKCEICSGVSMENREIDIYIEAYLPDRRRSWVHA